MLLLLLLVQRGEGEALASEIALVHDGIRAHCTAAVARATQLRIHW